MKTAGMDQRVRGTYLIVSDDYLVAQDLAESIVWFDAAASVVVRHAPADAIAALEAIETVAVAFVGAGPDQLAASGLKALIGDRGGRVVLMGNLAETNGEAEGWAVLHRPFSLGLVLTHLEGSAAN